MEAPRTPRHRLYLSLAASNSHLSHPHKACPTQTRTSNTCTVRCTAAGVTGRAAAAAAACRRLLGVPPP
jgi:hypothetical protein